MANIELTLTPASPTGSMIFTLGAPGPQGLAGTMEVGTVTTGAPGSSATIVNVGTPSAAILDFEIPRGDVGAQGAKGDKGDQGDPGPSGVVYATAPLSYDSGTQTVSIDLSAYATQSYVTSQGFITSAALTPYLTSATAASTYQTISGMSSYLTTSAAASTYLAKSGGYITGDIQSNNGSGYRTYDGLYQSVALLPSQLQFNNAGVGGGTLTIDALGISFADGKQTVRYPGLSILNGYATESWVTSELGSYLTTSAAASTYYPLTNPSGFISDAPSDGTIYGRQNGSWVTAGSGGSSWGSITGTLSNQTDLQSALDAKYDASNPAGFITSADLSGYATESWVNSQGFLTTAILDGYAQLSGSIFTGEISFSASSTGRLIIDSFYEAGGNTYSRFTFGTSTGTPSSVSNGDVWFDGSQLKYGQSGIQTVASQSWVNNLVGNYALKSGATFTGKVITTTTATTPSLNLGSAIATVPTGATNGDIWITNATAPKIAFQTQGTNYYCVVANQFNTFTGGVAISGNSASNAQLAVSQSGSATAVTISTTGTGKALVVSDESPETTATVIDNSGNIGVGVDPATWTASNKIEVVGNTKSSTFSNGSGPTFAVTATAAHTGGTDTLDLLVTINGTNYRIGLRPA